VPYYLNWQDAVDPNKRISGVPNPHYQTAYLLRCRLDARAEAMEDQLNRD